LIPAESEVKVSLDCHHIWFLHVNDSSNLTACETQCPCPQSSWKDARSWQENCYDVPLGMVVQKGFCNCNFVQARRIFCTFFRIFTLFRPSRSLLNRWFTEM
jgi:hypothetical protein